MKRDNTLTGSDDENRDGHIRKGIVTGNLCKTHLYIILPSGKN